MANCPICKRPVGIFAKVCDVCRRRQQVEETQRRAAETQVQQQRRAAEAQAQQQRRAEEEERLRQQVEGRADELIALNKRGRRLLIYHSEYLPVDSVLNDETIGDEFDITVIRALGLDGWEVVQVVPRTLGVGLTNASLGSTMGETWGAGVGGNVLGVHVLLKKELDFTNEPLEGIQREELVWYLSSHGLDSELVGGPHGEGGRETAVASTQPDELRILIWPRARLGRSGAYRGFAFSSFLTRPCQSPACIRRLAPRCRASLFVSENTFCQSGLHG